MKNFIEITKDTDQLQSELLSVGAMLDAWARYIEHDERIPEDYALFCSERVDKVATAVLEAAADLYDLQWIAPEVMDEAHLKRAVLRCAVHALSESERSASDEG